ADHLYLIAHGKSKTLGTGRYDDQPVLAVLADGDHFGAFSLVGPEANWPITVQALTSVIVLALSRQRCQELLSQSEALRTHVETFLARPRPTQNKNGEAAIDIAAGHEGEPALPGTFADYEPSPREYPLSVAQAILRIHTRIADLYNEPINQTEQQ